MEAAFAAQLQQLRGRPVAAVVVGASAGAIEALDQLLPALPASLPAPVAIVVHLPPGRRSQLAELFAPRCAVEVREAEDKAPLAPGAVYFAPPDYHLLVERGGWLALSADPPVNYSRPSIDALFDSASWAYGPRLLGIVLSGANQDGAAGLAGIRRRGGLGWAQAPGSALVDTMPRAAIAAANPDCVLTVGEMAALLAAWREGGA